jgi:pimeloyl-ACP methyl ester carboxylesterase
LDAYKLDLERMRGIRVPTLLLVGGASPPFRRTVTETLRAALPQAQIEELPGQGHGAIQAAPELFARAVMRFLA